MAPNLFDGHRRAEAEQTPKSIVQPRLDESRRKDFEKRTVANHPVESFRTLLDKLGTVAENHARLQGSDDAEFYVLTQPTPIQHLSLKLLDVSR